MEKLSVKIIFLTSNGSVFLHKPYFFCILQTIVFIFLLTDLWATWRTRRNRIIYKLNYSRILKHDKEDRFSLIYYSLCYILKKCYLISTHPRPRTRPPSACLFTDHLSIFVSFFEKKFPFFLLLDNFS